MKNINKFSLLGVIGIFLISLIGCNKFNESVDTVYYKVDRPAGSLCEDVRSLPKASGIALRSGSSIPDFFDLSDKMPPIGDQGSIGSCTSWAVGYALKSYQEHIQYGTPYTYSTLMSPSFMHNQICVDVENNKGAYIADALGLLVTTGICTLEDKQYSLEECKKAPTFIQLESAKKNKIGSDWGTIVFTEIQAYISLGIPVICDVEIYTGAGSLYNLRREGNKMMWDVNTGERDGYHAMCIIGYDNSSRRFKIQNSWGYIGGSDGMIYADYDALKGVTRALYVAYDEEEESIYGDGPAITVSGAMLFGTVEIDSYTTRTMTVSNRGNAALEINSIECPEGFVANWTSGTIPVDGSKEIVLTFSPTRPGEYTGFVKINSNAVNGNSKSFPVMGIGAEPGIAILGDLNVNSLASMMTITIQNTGNALLTINSVECPEGFTANWTSGTIPGGLTKMLVITFDPAIVKDYNGSIVIKSNAANVSTLYVTLKSLSLMNL